MKKFSKNVLAYFKLLSNTLTWKIIKTTVCVDFVNVKFLNSHAYEES